MRSISSTKKNAHSIRSGAQGNRVFYTNNKVIKILQKKCPSRHATDRGVMIRLIPSAGLRTISPDARASGAVGSATENWNFLNTHDCKYRQLNNKWEQSIENNSNLNYQHNFEFKHGIFLT